MIAKKISTVEINTDFIGEEGKATHRQDTQEIKIFPVGHFASICV